MSSSEVALRNEIYDAFAGVTREGGISWGEATRQALAHDEWMEGVEKPDHMFHGRDISWRDFQDYYDRWLDSASEEDTQSVDGYPDFSPELMAEIDARNPRKNSDLESSFHDRDTRWADIIEDPEWCIEGEQGGIHWVDSIARRYYLPAALIRCLDDPGSFEFAPELTCHRPGAPGSEFMGGLDDCVARFEEGWSALDKRQKLCVKAFVKFKMDLEKERYQTILDMVELMPKEPTDLFLRSLPWRRAYLGYWVNV